LTPFKFSLLQYCLNFHERIQPLEFCGSALPCGLFENESHELGIELNAGQNGRLTWGLRWWNQELVFPAVLSGDN